MRADEDEAHVVDLTEEEAPLPLPFLDSPGSHAADSGAEDSDDAMDVDTAVVAPRAPSGHAAAGVSAEDGAAAMDTGHSGDGAVAAAAGPRSASVKSAVQPAWLSPAGAAAAGTPGGGQITLPTLAPAASTPGMFTGAPLVAPVGSRRCLQCC